MPFEQIASFLTRISTDEGYCRGFLDAPEETVNQTDMEPAERWAVVESLLDADSERDFCNLLRTRLAVIGIAIGTPPRGVERIFAVPWTPIPRPLE